MMATRMPPTVLRASLHTSLAWAATTLPALAQTVATAPSPATGAPPVGAGSLLQVLLWLGVVLALLAGTAWLMKRSGLARTGAASVARVVGGVSVGNRERVLVVEVGDQWVVVGVAPGRVNSLATMPKQELPAASAAPLNPLPQPNFGAWLKQTMDKRNGG